ncbi:MAG: lactonase family protein [Solirubrobacteraceae bacterium]
MRPILRAILARPGLWLVFALGALSLPASAQARLTYQTCVKAPSETVTSCPAVASDNAIATPSQISLSPEGSTAYVTGESMGAGSGNVGIFSTVAGLRQTGALPNAAAVSNGGWPTSSVVSPDGNNVYVTALSGLWTYTRSHADGSLSGPSCFGGPSSPSCPIQEAEMTDPVGVLTSPDGHNVYVINHQQAAPSTVSSISEFSRAAGTGTLTHTGCLDTASEGSCTLVPGSMVGLRGLVISPNGRFAVGAAYPGGPAGGAVVEFSRDAASGALSYARCYGPGSGCISIQPHSTIPLSVAISPDASQLYVSYGDQATSNNISTYSIDSTTGALTFAGCIANALPSCSPSPDQFYDNAQLLPSPDGRDLYVMDNGEAIAEYGRDPATGVLSYVGCYSWPGRTGYGGACTNSAAGLFYSLDMVMSPSGSALYAVSWGNNPWSGPGGSLADNGGGVVDAFSRAADVVARTPSPAIVTSSATLGGAPTFGKRLGAGRRHRSRGAKATITVRLRCPDGVTRYCAGVLRQLGGPSIAVSGRTDKHGGLIVKLKLHLSKAQMARLRRFAGVRVTVVFVQQMPDGRHRTTRRIITIK